MKKLILMIITLVVANAHAHEAFTLHFVEQAETLFKIGQVSETEVIIPQPYRWLGGSFVIDFSYKVSRLNDSLTCYHLDLSKLSLVDGTRIELQKLELAPEYFCETQIDVQRSGG